MTGFFGSSSWKMKVLLLLLYCYFDWSNARAKKCSLSEFGELLNNLDIKNPNCSESNISISISSQEEIFPTYFIKGLSSFNCIPQKIKEHMIRKLSLMNKTCRGKIYNASKTLMFEPQVSLTLIKEKLETLRDLLNST